MQRFVFSALAAGAGAEAEAGAGARAGPSPSLDRLPRYQSKQFSSLPENPLGFNYILTV